MSVLDELTGSDGLAAEGAEPSGPPEPPAHGRRWPIYLLLLLLLAGALIGFVLIGTGDASAAGGCGGG